jgi:hypothetical protein
LFNGAKIQRELIDPLATKAKKIKDKQCVMYAKIERLLMLMDQ